MQTSLNNIGKRIKVVRTSLGLNQKDFAEVLHSTQATISNIENGKELISTDKLIMLAQHAKISVDIILFGEDAEALSSNILK